MQNIGVKYLCLCVYMSMFVCLFVCLFVCVQFLVDCKQRIRHKTSARVLADSVVVAGCFLFCFCTLWVRVWDRAWLRPGPVLAPSNASLFPRLLTLSLVVILLGLSNACSSVCPQTFDLTLRNTVYSVHCTPHPTTAQQGIFHIILVPSSS